MPSWPNGQGLGLLSRRLRVRVPPKVVFNDYFRQMENENCKVKEYETSVEEKFKIL